MHILSELLTGALPASPKDPTDWKAQWLRAKGPWPERAVLGGLGSACPGWAFAWGYSCALRALLPGLHGVAALVVNEGRNTRPSSITCSAEDGRLTGRKSFVFLGAEADTLLVLAKTGERQGRAVLRVFPVTSGAPGVRHGPVKLAPFVPEVPHGALELDLPCPPPLPGDGWSDIAKPFRLYEDLFVSLALLGHGARLCRANGLPPETLESLLPPALALLHLAPALQAPGAARALSPIVSQAQSALESLPWKALPKAHGEAWRRDRLLFALGIPARERALFLARGAKDAPM